MNDQYALMMTKFALLDGFTVAGAHMLLESGEVKDYGPGEVLLREGDAAMFVLLVLGGKLQVFVERRGRDLVIREVGPGTIIGELAVLCGSSRSASVRAAEKSVVLQWGAQAFRVMLLRHQLLSERVLKHALDTMVERERALVAALIDAQDNHKKAP